MMNNVVEMGVTHILNVTCREYMKRRKYFKYLDIQIYDAHNEDAKKHFRITNRFIDEGRRDGQEQSSYIHSSISDWEREDEVERWIEFVEVICE
jgi:hypothetical protein